MVSRTFLILAIAIPAWAQFTQLATTDDAQQLYFSSQLRIAPSSPASPEYRIFNDGPDGTYLFAERGTLTPVVTNGSYSSGSSDGMIAPQVSGDGSLIGLTAHRHLPQRRFVHTVILRRFVARSNLGRPGTRQLATEPERAVGSADSVTDAPLCCSNGHSVRSSDESERPDPTATAAGLGFWDGSIHWRRAGDPNLPFRGIDVGHLASGPILSPQNHGRDSSLGLER